MPRTKSLVIVESPAKARTIASYLGPDYLVESSIGHIRDLPRNAGDVPAAYKKHAWSRLGVDVDNDFKPLYVVDREKKTHIARLKSLLREAQTLYLATDEDREGESIAWHLLEVLEPKVPVKRMVFHEITKKAIEHAIRRPRDLDRRLVDAQEARRILDRLYGYEVSPVLWKKVMPRLSAGRVQSVAIRMIVEREQQRIAFVPAGYWDLEGSFACPGRQPARFAATLCGLNGQRVATGKDFDASGVPAREGVVVLDEPTASRLAESLRGVDFEVRSLEQKPSRRSPSAPFMTSTLQQEAARKLRFSAARTMRVAQRLYENGYITYMRTDSTTLSAAAVGAARHEIERLFGADYLPEKPRVYSKKVKNAQEAHEAIRPAGDVIRSPEQVAAEVDPDEARLYELVWMRTLASQMRDASGQSVSLRLGAGLEDGQDVEFSVSGHTITFPGFLRAYVEGSDDPSAELENRERPLPAVRVGEQLPGEAFEAKGHETQPPARYTEASLVRRLEEQGVGRPSTYASILTTILDRGYVWKKGTALVPSFTAFAVVALLKQHFAALVDYEFTARMEDDLDDIASGVQQAVPWLRSFYFGKANGQSRSEPLGGGLKALVGERLEQIDARAINSLPIGTDSEGREVVVRVGRFGAYLQRGEETARIPEDLPPDEIGLSRACELLEAPSGERILGNDPETGLPVTARNGRFGAYVQLGGGGTGKQKPKTVSLLASMSLDTITLEDGLRLLQLPRMVGADPDSGNPITAQLGRYGPYVAKGTDSRSLDTEEQVFTVTLEQALALFAQPKTRGRRTQKATEPLRELGVDPVSGGVITLREGRFGPYVTDGQTNASLRKGDTVDGILPERAQELLQIRRERGPAPKKKRAAKTTTRKTDVKKTIVKKAATKKATAKKAVTKKTAAKKTAAKKTAAKKTAPEKVDAKAAPKRAGARKTTARKAPPKRSDGAAAHSGVSPADSSGEASGVRSSARSQARASDFPSRPPGVGKPSSVSPE